jgi:hypothetical protein
MKMDREKARGETPGRKERKRQRDMTHPLLGLDLQLVVQRVALVRLLLTTQTAPLVEVHANDVCLPATLIQQIAAIITP